MVAELLAARRNSIPQHRPRNPVADCMEEQCHSEVLSRESSRGTRPAVEIPAAYVNAVVMLYHDPFDLVRTVSVGYHPFLSLACDDVGVRSPGSYHYCVRFDHCFQRLQVFVDLNLGDWYRSRYR